MQHIWRVFVDDQLPLIGGSILLSMEESHYLSRVLRLRSDEPFEVTDGRGSVALAVNDGQSGSRIYAKVLEILEQRVLRKDIRLFLAQPDRKALEEVCYHASSVGFSQVVIFKGYQSRALSPVRVKRLETLMQESLRFSRNPWLPELFAFGGKLDEGLMEALVDLKTLLYCDEELEPQNLRKINFSTESSVGVFVGPESGWSHEERTLFDSDKRFQPISLGPWVQKVPKAALNVGCIMQNLL